MLGLDKVSTHPKDVVVNETLNIMVDTKVQHNAAKPFIVQQDTTDKTSVAPRALAVTAFEAVEPIITPVEAETAEKPPVHCAAVIATSNFAHAKIY